MMNHLPCGKFQSIDLYISGVHKIGHMQVTQSDRSLTKRQRWKLNWIAWRNRLFARGSFQRWASRTPIVRRIARQRAQRLFDLVAGFTYTQVLQATEESGLLDLLGQGAQDLATIVEATALPPDAAERLVRAATGIGIAEEVLPAEAEEAVPGAVAVYRAAGTITYKGVVGGDDEAEKPEGYEGLAEAPMERTVDRGRLDKAYLDYVAAAIQCHAQQNRLISVEYDYDGDGSGLTAMASYSYDAQGRRILDTPPGFAVVER